MSAGNRRATTVIAWLTAKQAARSAAVWGVLFGTLVMEDALGYHSNYPTPPRGRRWSAASATTPR